MNKDRVLVHATTVLLGAAAKRFGGPENAGVLILGESGSGKSDLALRLIAMGAMLLADDQTELFARGGKLHAECPENLRGLMEVRGLGILRLDHAVRAPLALAVRLVEETPERMPEPAIYTPPMELGPVAPLPLVDINPFEAAAPAKVAAAAASLAQGRIVAGFTLPH